MEVLPLRIDGPRAERGTMLKHTRAFMVQVAAAAVAIGLVGILAGCSGGGDTGTQQTASSGAAGGTGAGASGNMPMMGPSMGGSGMGMPTGPMGGSMMGGMGPMGGMMGGSAAGGAAQTAAVPPKNTTPPAHRVDPFMPWWDTTPPPPPVLSVVAPVRVAITDSAAKQNQPGIEIKEVPNRRVAGILSGNGVYALIDGPGGQTVVKPGDMIDDYRVAAINPDSVVLKKEVKVGSLKQTYTQVVPLTDVGTSMGGQTRGPVYGGPAGPGAPRGMFPGLGGGGK